MKKFISPFLIDEDNFLLDFPTKSGLSLYEKNNSIYVEADLPGLSSDEIEISLDDDVLSIQGEQKEESKDKERKYHQKSHRSYSYRVSLPGNIDKAKEPEAKFEKGVLKIPFGTTTATQAKKIPIK